MPNTASPLRVSAISEPQFGMPEMKDFVPSIGSSTQTYSASARSLPYSSPTMPCSGKLRLISPRIAFSAARSACVTGSKPTAAPLSSTPSDVRKNGKIASPEMVASSSTKAAKSMAVMNHVFPGSPDRPIGVQPRGQPLRALARCVTRRRRPVRGGNTDTIMPSPAGRLPRGAVLLVGALAAISLVSQFLRNSVGVIAPDLAREIGLNAAEIGLLSSAFFFAFAAAQIPLGIALDRYGPKRCMLICAAIALLGTLLFAVATTLAGLVTARILMGLGSSCYLMAPLALYAKRFPPERFTLLAGIQIGIGTVGTLFVTAPLAWASAAIGWRATFFVVAGFVVAGALLVALVVPEDAAERIEAGRGGAVWGGMRGVLGVAR